MRKTASASFLSIIVKLARDTTSFEILWPLITIKSTYRTRKNPCAILSSCLIYFVIVCTLPILPFVRRTLIPWGWVGLLVRMSLTVPSVSLPLRWSCFWMMATFTPALIWLRGGLGCICCYACIAAYSAFALRTQEVMDAQLSS
jgi:hypothetical protein